MEQKETLRVKLFIMQKVEKFNNFTLIYSFFFLWIGFDCINTQHTFVDITIQQADNVAAIKNNNNKVFKVSHVKFNHFDSVFAFKYNGQIVHRSFVGRYCDLEGAAVKKPDTILYRIRAKIEDDAGNPLWCTLFDELGHKLFGISAKDLFEQIEEIEKQEPTKNWQQDLVTTLNHLKVNLIIRCSVNRYNDTIHDEDKMQKTWIVDSLEAVQNELE